MIAPGAALTAIQYQVGTLRPVQDLLRTDIQIERVNDLIQKGVTAYSEFDRPLSGPLSAAIARSLDEAGVAPAAVDAVIVVTESFARLFDPEDGEADGRADGRADSRADSQVDGGEDMFRRVRNRSFDFLSELGIAKASVFCASYGGCTNLLQAVLLAQALVEKGMCRNVLLIAAERFGSARTRLLDEATSIAGDGIASCLIVPSAGAGPGSFRFRHVGTAPYKKLQMDGDVPNILLEMFRAMKDAAAACHDACGSTPEDFRWLVLGDYNPQTSRTYARLLGFEGDRVFMDNVGRMGHIPFDTLINLQDLYDKGKVESGESVMSFLCGPVSCGSLAVEIV